MYNRYYLANFNYTFMQVEYVKLEEPILISHHIKDQLVQDNDGNIIYIKLTCCYQNTEIKILFTQVYIPKDLNNQCCECIGFNINRFYRYTNGPIIGYFETICNIILNEQPLPLCCDCKEPVTQFQVTEYIKTEQEFAEESKSYADAEKELSSAIIH